ncbi:MAG: hypothetical protein PWP72_2209 [Thermoanaerobacter sp.]|nr:hypothetical protein [Thermoanaerobacter sp.]
MRGANALYEGHRIILPGIRERAAATCRGCRFCVPIVGREETRLACLATLDIYLTGTKRVPEELKALDFIWLAGREALLKAVEKVRPEGQACGFYGTKG